MRCLIPVTQEQYPENAMSRAERLCDEVILLYVVDRRLIEKVEAESSYILPSYALESVEDLVVNIHRKEAEKLKERIKGVPVELRFIVGDFYQTLEREVIRSEPDLIMVDELYRGILGFSTPIWVDGGGSIREATLVIDTIRKPKTLKRKIEFSEEVCNRLNCSLYLYYQPGDREGMEALKPLGKLTNTPRGELMICLERKRFKEGKIILLL